MSSLVLDLGTLSLIAEYINSCYEFEKYQQMSIDSYIAIFDITIPIKTWFSVFRPNLGTSIRNLPLQDYPEWTRSVTSMDSIVYIHAIHNFSWNLKARPKGAISLDVVDVSNTLELTAENSSVAAHLSYASKIGLIDTVRYVGFSHTTNLAKKSLSNIATCNLDLTRMHKLEYIGDRVFGNSTRSDYNIQSIKFSPLARVKRIDEKFLFDMGKFIRELELPNMSFVCSIGNFFMCDVAIPFELDLSSNTQLETIGHSCMSSSGLTRFRLGSQGLPSLRSIGATFLANCKNITNLELGGLSSLESIGESFLEKSRIRRVVIRECPKLLHVQKKFLYQCTALEYLDISGLTGIKYVWDDFACRCFSLKTIMMPNATGLRRIGNQFMAGCIAVEELDLSFANKIEELGSRFLSRCLALRTIKFPDSLPLTYLPPEFISRSSALETLDLRGFKEVKFINEFVLYRSLALREIKFPAHGKVKRISYKFLDSCPKLINIDIRGMTTPDLTIYPRFAGDCSALANILTDSPDKWTILSDFAVNCNLLTIDRIAYRSKIVSENSEQNEEDDGDIPVNIDIYNKLDEVESFFHDRDV